MKEDIGGIVENMESSEIISLRAKLNKTQNIITIVGAVCLIVGFAIGLLISSVTPPASAAGTGSASNNPFVSKAQPSDDLNVIFAYEYDNHEQIIVQNTGDSVITDFTIAYLGFDKNGYCITINDYESTEQQAVNILPGEKRLCQPYSGGDDSAYVKAEIISINYADGSTWEMTDPVTWAADVKKSFSIDTERAYLESLSPAADSAQNSPYVNITDVRREGANPHSDYGDIVIDLENISGRDIVCISFMILQFDSSGYPVNVFPYDFMTTNSQVWETQVTVPADFYGWLRKDRFLRSDTAKIKATVYSIEFADGEEWENPSVYEWVVCNWKNY